MRFTARDDRAIIIALLAAILAQHHDGWLSFGLNLLGMVLIVLTLVIAVSRTVLERGQERFSE